MEEKHRDIQLLKQITPLIAEEAADHLRSEDTEIIADTLIQINSRKAADILHHLGLKKTIDTISLMAPDDAVDIVGQFHHGFRRKLLKKLPEDTAHEIKELLKYPPDTAGGIMTTEFLSFSPETTIQQALTQFRQKYDSAESVYYVYILSPSNELLGTISLKELILAQPGQTLAEAMETNVETLPVHLDQEEVAQFFDTHDYQSIPVVKGNKMEGIITFDDVIDVMRKEAAEDLQKLGGGSHHEQIFSPWTFKVKKRAPWLYLNLIAAFLAATVVSAFEGTIAQIAILAAFLPILNNQAGNTGMQALSVAIRGQATGEMDYGRVMNAVSREVFTGITNGILIGTAIGIVTYLWQGNFMLGVVVALAMGLTIIVSTIGGFLVPLILEKLGKDPAMASSIFVTAIADISGIFFLLSLATLYLL